MPIPEAVAALEKTQHANKEVLTGLKYIPDDKLDWVPMGKAKTPRIIVLECAGAYRGMAALIRGGPVEWSDPKPSEFPTREAVVADLNAALGELAGALETLTPEQLAEKRQVPWGEETVGNVMWMGFWHSVYHAGQLNYIQMLLGDTEMHHE